MRITTTVLKPNVFEAVSYKVVGKTVKCVVADEEPRTFLLKDLVWVNGVRGSFRICHLIKEEISGVQVKSISGSKIDGFATAILPDNSKLILNKSLHRKYKE